MIRSRTVVIVLASSLVPLAAGPQDPPRPDQQPPVFRAGVEAVPIYATVLNRYGEMLLGLTREEFEVLDEGRPQELTVFEAGLQPITAVVLVDTSASMTLNLQLALSAAEQFVIRMLPDDQARVGSFSDRVDISPTFTNDRDQLLRGLREDMHIGNPTRLWDAIEETTAALAPLGGRRVILLLTDGMDTLSDAEPQGVLARSRVNEVMTYVVQFRSTPQANIAEFPRAPTAGDLFSGDDVRRARASPALVSRLARQSGGGYFVLGQYDDVNATFSHVMRELHYQYVLGFTPQRADGRIHQLEVRIRRPNVIVRARQSYLAPQP